MEAEKLIEDMRRSNFSMRNRHKKRKKETKNDYIKRKSRYECSYCHKKLNKNRLNASVEPFHRLKKYDDVNKVAALYRTSVSELEKLNPETDLNNISKGDIINVPKYFKIFPNTHGICYCDKCGKDRKRLGMTHADYVKHVLKRRKTERNKVTNDFKMKVFKRDNYKCQYCEIEYGEQQSGQKLTLDHKKPIVKEGETTIRNAITSCDFHNKDKGKLEYELYVKRIKKRRFEREIKL